MPNILARFLPPETVTMTHWMAVLLWIRLHVCFFGQNKRCRLEEETRRNIIESFNLFWAISFICSDHASSHIARVNQKSERFLAILTDTTSRTAFSLAFGVHTSSIEINNTSSAENFWLYPTWRQEHSVPEKQEQLLTRWNLCSVLKSS